MRSSMTFFAAAVLQLLTWPVKSQTMNFVNSSSPRRPTFVVNFDISAVICQQTPDDPMSVKLFPISALCDGHQDCVYSPAMSDETFPYCSTACSPRCTRNGACLMDGERAQCYCDEGYTGKACEVKDVNECTQKPCHWMARCTNTFGSYYCTCMPGFAGDGYNCTDIDECENPRIANKCPRYSKCCNIPGSYFCNCTEGFKPVGQPLERCEDIDECANGLAECPDGHVCRNTKGSYKCVPELLYSVDCKPGYEARGEKCIDIDECADGLHNCDERAICENIPGGFKCACEDGFRGNGTTCTPVIDCGINPQICHPNAFCVPGLKLCFCEKGYMGDGIFCSDVNECMSDPNICEKDERCVNLDGTYSCCDKAQSEAECTEEKLKERSEEKSKEKPLMNIRSAIRDGCNPDGSECGEDSFCDLSTGECRCKSGFIGGPPAKPCRDANECTEKLHDCEGNSVCENIAGGYMCLCPDGFIPTGNDCKDVDECEESPCDANADCTNLPGAFECKCRSGYYGDGYKCRESGAVACFTAGQKAKCDPAYECLVNKESGEVSCKACARGYELQDTECVDVDECASGAQVCHADASCTNTVGSYQCVCKSGYRGNGFYCEDVNQCLRADKYCHPQATCINEPGDYKCLCAGPYVGSGETNCHLPTGSRCDGNSTLCPPNSYCIDTEEGDFFCQCHHGYRLSDSGKCEDVNECAENRADCDPRAAICVNFPGGFKCECAEGYEGTGGMCLDFDENKTKEKRIPVVYYASCTIDILDTHTLIVCHTDVNECRTGDNVCDPNADCANTPGSYVCACNDGFDGNGRVCNETGTAQSERACSVSVALDCEGHHMTCVISAKSGRPECGECLPGYVGEPHHCKLASESECADPTKNECSPHAKCLDLDPTGHSCTCLGGFLGDGKNCDDIDECYKANGDCDKNAVCINTIGSYTCTCKDGYTGDGKQCQPMCPDALQPSNVTGSCSPDINFCPSGYICHNTVCCPDIDDPDNCVAHPDICDNRASCVEARCVCPPGYTSDGRKCKDIDECSSRARCTKFEKCVNIDGGHLCCTPDSDNELCEEACHCEKHPDVCSPNAVCRNGKCVCKDGYIGNGIFCEEVVTTCADDPSLCHEFATCKQEKCICNDGYVGDGPHCEDIDECSVANPCQSHQLCVNTDGYHLCCEPGADHQLCEDALKCDLHTGICSRDADCIAGTCVCRSGFVGNGIECTKDTDQAECVRKVGLCHVDAKCDPKKGCVCKEGYSGNGLECSDINECAAEDFDLCDKDSVCVNTVGSFICCNDQSTNSLCKLALNCDVHSNVCSSYANCRDGECVCSAGTVGNGIFCEIGDKEDCILNRDLCDPNGHCEKLRRRCECNTGYIGDGIECKPDPLDCIVNTSLCVENARCIDRRCSCIPSYEGDAYVNCGPTDSDDCIQSANLCHNLAACDEKTQRCVCNVGYIGNGKSCVPDPNDCQVNAGLCHTNARCNARRCECDRGYKGDGKLCTPIDSFDCSIIPGLCHRQAACIGTRCQCNPGWEGNGIKVCRPVSKDCSLNPDICHVYASCRDRVCVCNPGFEGNGLACTASDDQNCTLRPSICHQFASCEEGKCQCKQGYLGDGVTCSPDPDDCGYGSAICHEHANCIDNSCKCKQGYAGDGKMCLVEPDQNCQRRPLICSLHADCISSRCVCHKGYLGDGFNCKPDPYDCAVQSTICHSKASCQDRRCECREGYEGDGITCAPTDTDDCLTDADICDLHATCQNRTLRGRNVGRCICNDGFEGSGRTCRHPCDNPVDNKCSLNGICRRTDSVPQGYKCFCKDGYIGDGFTCTDVNECSSNPCHKLATCTNTEGSFECNCPVGFTGDGISDCLPREAIKGLVNVECGHHGISLLMESEKEFNGRIFVKSQSRNNFCSREYTAKDGPLYKFTATFEHCDIKKSQNEENTYTVIVVIQNHPLFITDEAIAYRLKCSYPTGDKMVANHLNVSMINTHASYSQAAPMGQCNLKVITPESTTTVSDAFIGQMLHIELDVSPSDIYGVLARNCMAVNMDDGDTYGLTDDKGCPIDEVIFPAWRKRSESVVYTEFMSFKWPDTSRVRFQCDCVVCFDSCPPAECPGGPSYGRKKRMATSSEEIDRLVLPVFTKVMNIRESEAKMEEDFDMIEDGEEAYGIQVLSLQPSLDREICVSTAAFAFTVGLAAFLVVVVAAMGVCMLRRRGTSKLASNSYAESSLAVGTQVTDTSSYGGKRRMGDVIIDRKAKRTSSMQSRFSDATLDSDWSAFGTGK